MMPPEQGPSALLLWLAAAGWVLLLMDPVFQVVRFASEQAFGFPFTGLNWVPILFVSYWNAPAWELGVVLLLEFIILLAWGGAGVYLVARKNGTGFVVLIACGAVALLAYPAFSVGPALMMAVGVAGVLGRNAKGPAT